MTKEIQRAMALLAFKPETSCSPYRVNKINKTLSPTCRQILFDWANEEYSFSVFNKKWNMLFNAEL